MGFHQSNHFVVIHVDNTMISSEMLKAAKINGIKRLKSLFGSCIDFMTSLVRIYRTEP